MIAELLENLLEKDFKDVFQPLSDEEREERLPNDIVVLVTDIFYNPSRDAFITRKNNSFSAIDKGFFKVLNKGDIIIPLHPENPDDEYSFSSLDGNTLVDLEPEWYVPYKKGSK